MAPYTPRLQFLRDNTYHNDRHTGKPGDITIDEQRKRLRLHDGAKLGGMEIPNIQDLGKRLLKASVVDNLTSNSSADPLSAKQGKILKGFIDNINDILTSDDVNLDELQEVVDFIKANRDDLNSLGITNIAGLTAALNSKVDKVAGKTLSDNNFSDAEVSKLSGIEAGAEVNRPVTASRSSSSTTTVLNAKGMNDHTNSGDHDGRYYTKGQVNGLVDAADRSTNLSMGGSGDNRVIVSSTGNNTAVPIASTSNAGFMSTGDKSKLNAIEAGAQRNVGDEFDENGNYAGLRARATTKADVGLPNVNDVALNWDWGDDPLTHMWGSSGDSTESYVYNASDVADFLGLGTAAYKGWTSSRNSGSIDLLLSAKGMNDHTNSGDHDGRYYTKAQVDSRVGSVDTTTNLGLGGSGDNRSITSSSGSNVTVPLVSGSTAGFMSRADKNKLNAIESGAEKNVPTNLSITGSGNNRTIVSSTGNNLDVPIASALSAGFMSTGDKSKLHSIEAGAEKNVGDTFNANGNYGGLRARSTTKADVGLPNVNDVALNWSYGTEPLTHVWGSSGDSTESYVYRASDLSDFLGLGTAAVRGYTSSRTSSSTGLLLTAKGMNDHRTSGDHDGRYYTKSQVNGLVDAADRSTNLSVGGSGNNRTINSSTGSNASVPLASTNHAGFMSPSDKSKLDNIESSADKNVPTATKAEAQAAALNTRMMSPLRTKEAFEKFVENGFAMARTNRSSVIDFGRSDTDRGYIEHVTSSHINPDSGEQSGNSLFKFHVSDDATLDNGGYDRYEFGATTGDTYYWWLMVNRYGITSRGDVVAFSDGRNKKNFRSWDDPLAMLKQMRGGTYDRTDMDKTQVGVIAQEMEKVLPEVVSYTEEDDQYAVAYGNLTAFLIETCKSLLERVEELEKKQGDN